MNKRELYRDIFNDGSAPDFEEALLRRTVRTARRTRRTRIAGRGAVVALVAGLAIVQFWPRRPVEMASTPPKLKEVVLNRTVVKTQPFTGGIRTVPLAAERVLTTSPATVMVLKTGATAAGEVQVIDDEQLLAFFSGKAVALVHRGPHAAELVFLDGEREE